MSEKCISRAELDKIFPPERTDAFFEAIYGDIEEGAYDIKLVCKHVKADEADFVFELVRREGKCLVCSVTYGLPEVFQKHPIINIAGTAKALASALGWQGEVNWTLGSTMEINEDLQMIPFTITQKAN